MNPTSLHVKRLLTAGVLESEGSAKDHVQAIFHTSKFASTTDDSINIDNFIVYTT